MPAILSAPQRSSRVLLRNFGHWSVPGYTVCPRHRDLVAYMIRHWNDWDENVLKSAKRRFPPCNMVYCCENGPVQVERSWEVIQDPRNFPFCPSRVHPRADFVEGRNISFAPQGVLPMHFHKHCIAELIRIESCEPGVRPVLLTPNSEIALTEGCAMFMPLRRAHGFANRGQSGSFTMRVVLVAQAHYMEHDFYPCDSH